MNNDLRKARRRYVREMARAIRGRQSPLFNVQSGPETIAKVTSTMGANTSQYGLGNQPAISLRRKKMSDQIHATEFAHPNTDVLAYHRRIEQPQVFSHAPSFGF